MSRKDTKSQLEILDKVTMKTKIEEIQAYFKAKLLAGEFEPKVISRYHVVCTIDGYDFDLWVGNIDIPTTRKQDHDKYNFIDLGLTDEDAVVLDSLLRPSVVKYMREEEIERREQELAKLREYVGA